MAKLLFLCHKTKSQGCRCHKVQTISQKNTIVTQLLIDISSFHRVSLKSLSRKCKSLGFAYVELTVVAWSVTHDFETSAHSHIEGNYGEFHLIII